MLEDGEDAQQCVQACKAVVLGTWMVLLRTAKRRSMLCAEGGSGHTMHVTHPAACGRLDCGTKHTVHTSESVSQFADPFA